ncbi:hypothetical protein HPB52_016061 [Rhipicephalus sanguineus]|uniref:Secreted protein n=1 Tax=Rhipicephalus sanguineus TaxID=34632 RepID=A0A9D4YQA9_RHISA|nr:hypothetical protein HPB52_016061 [Rhipicephalus sanguineus]
MSRSRLMLLQALLLATLCSPAAAGPVTWTDTPVDEPAGLDVCVDEADWTYGTFFKYSGLPFRWRAKQRTQAGNREPCQLTITSYQKRAHPAECAGHGIASPRNVAAHV